MDFKVTGSLEFMILWLHLEKLGKQNWKTLPPFMYALFENLYSAS